jgi:Thioesterase-like superfamily
MPGSPASFYSSAGDLFESAALTRGPWDPGSQHAGPPAALIGREIERLPADRPMQVGRITFEILRAVPIGPLRVEARIVRPGRRVEMAEATLSSGDEVLISARAWRLRIGETEIPDGLASAEEPAVPTRSVQVLRPAWTAGAPAGAEPGDFFATGQDIGYHTAMEYRFAHGSFLESGPATVWMRMRHPLVAGEEPSPLQRVLTVADSGNGVSSALDWRRYLFINVDLSVHLARMPEGEWVGLDAITIPERHGIGITDTALFDERGPFGRAAQTLLVSEREGSGD